MFRSFREQIDVIFREDPAATSILEVLICYPGLHAILLHRLAHGLFQIRMRFIARVLSQLARAITGIEIHPGATIGRRFFIDHGMGVVIGETTIIGDDVILYQGVTLGGTGKDRGKRHPTLGNSVVIGTGAKVLGNITLGNNVKVGAGSVVVHSVPDDSTVVGIPGRVVRSRGQIADDLEHGKMPDPQGQDLENMQQRIDQLESVLRSLLEERTQP
ncbi:MAG: serine O-acetyltransferase [Opitutus sp.]